jgi:hypothetical protein
MLGKVLEAACRLNVYIRRTGGHTHAISADGWGFSQMTGGRILVVRDARSRVIHVVGKVVRRGQVPKEDLDLLLRVRVVEESVTSSGRSEWEFLIQEVDEETQHQVLRSPIIEPGSLIGDGLRL